MFGKGNQDTIGWCVASYIAWLLKLPHMTLNARARQSCILVSSVYNIRMYQTYRSKRLVIDSTSLKTKSGIRKYVVKDP